MFNVEQKRRQISNRSTAVPMDFEFTNRPSSNIKPVWVPQESMTDHHFPLRLISNHFVTGDHDEGNPPPPPFPPLNVAPERSFTPTSEPRLFPAPGSPPLTQWQPPPSRIINPDVVDVDMSEVSPNIQKTVQQRQEDSPSKPEKESRVMTPRDRRRVIRSRYGKAALKQRDADADDADEESLINEDEGQSDHGGRVVGYMGRTNNHYTLNVAPSTPATKSDLPYTLSGSVLSPSLLLHC